MRTDGLLVLGLVGGLAVTPPSHAIDFTIGGGPGLAPDYEGSDDYEIVPYWIVRASNLYHPDTDISLIANRIYSNLIPSAHWRFGYHASYRFGRDDVEDDRVDALRDIDGELLMGVTGGYDFDPSPRSALALAVDALQSTGDDMGAILRLRGALGRPVSERVRVDAAVETTLADDDHMQTYFGISPADSRRSGLDRFDADGGFKFVSFNLSSTYRLTEQWSLTGAFRYDRLIGDAADSPIVDDRGDANQFFGIASVNYRF